MFSPKSEINLEPLTIINIKKTKYTQYVSYNSKMSINKLILLGLLNYLFVWSQPYTINKFIKFQNLD
jgi:hypothetical protein